MKKTIAATDPSTLRQWKGRPVPWITRWTGEVSETPTAMSIQRSTMSVVLRYKDGNEDHDDHGVLWMREGIGRQGEPQYSEVNAYRQRASVNKRLCQVCGTKIHDRPMRWLMPRSLLIDFEDTGDFGTLSAPTCEGCIPLALQLCPHLKANDYAILKVLDYERWGVMGQAVDVDLESEKYRDLRGIHLPYEGSPIPLTAIVAHQQVVRFTKFVFEKGFDGD